MDFLLQKDNISKQSAYNDLCTTIYLMKVNLLSAIGAQNRFTYRIPVHFGTLNVRSLVVLPFTIAPAKLKVLASSSQ